MANIKTYKIASAKAAYPKILKRRRQLEQDLEHITQEMYQRNHELVETNKTLSLLRTIDTIVLQSQESIKNVCEEIAKAITDVTGYPFVGILTRSPHFKQELELFGWSLPGQTSLDGLSGLSHIPRFHVHSPWLGGLKDAQLFSLDGLTHAEIATVLGSTEEEIDVVIDHLQLKTLYLIKLMARRKLAGVIMVGFGSKPEELVHMETRLLDRISESVGVALDNKLLFEENKHVLKQLKESNAKLRALDEAKDDFISMASHQLRTPLTSVKGYISMVMEGDVGKISTQQKTMLNQAFFSSQRMVYLIADLLNVSRLRTGKFMIESSAVNLANVVEQELSQLTETAKAKQLTLNYEKPKDFPDLMLDETKIRQVIMNFADNAIYYTPAGGHITVRLVDKSSTIELRIEDDGIGVPKAERHHLFTKFYRAGNARKARPDGTGLGLFMAKKVVMAQGGSIIFETEEGKGSTFGFAFSKSKLAAPTATAPQSTASKK
ncbi:MAG TPA: HAMP domain-containing sensor histidine kinase [Candidatus Saccharimonadales bacterium]|nr:HAMP domain-containing sensor histidine kinase [Candidatus Saccharimonadales bacterium]